MIIMIVICFGNIKLRLNEVSRALQRENGMGRDTGRGHGRANLADDLAEIKQCRQGGSAAAKMSAAGAVFNLSVASQCVFP